MTPIAEEEAPWELEDLQPMIDVIGAGPSTSIQAEYSLSEPARMFPNETSGLEYILVPQPPSHVSRVQLRGSTKPPWFPGKTCVR